MAHQANQQTLSLDEINTALSQICGLPLQRDDTITPFDENTFDKITRYLEQAQAHIPMHGRDWSTRPRLYAVLHNIEALDLMPVFIYQGFRDNLFPFSDKLLEAAISNRAKRSQFKRIQPFVLSKALDLEKGTEGRHRHFAQDGSQYFVHVADLGRGSEGCIVDHVKSKIGQNEYARKRIPRGKTFGKDKAILSKFENELSILKRLSHQHLVQLVGSYTDPRYVALLLEPVAECNLAEFLHRPSDIPTGKSSLRSWFGCLANAIFYLHQNEIRHKDIKPANILIKHDQIYVTDFGISLDYHDTMQETTQSTTARTPGYCAPEVWTGKRRNRSSDIWSLGCVFLEMVTVLKRQPLEDMKNFFLGHGTKENWISFNPEASSLWMEKLQATDGLVSDNQPIAWIKDMTQTIPDNRISAQSLVDRIRVSNQEPESKFSFYGSCCTESDGSVYSVESSELADMRDPMAETALTSIIQDEAELADTRDPMAETALTPMTQDEAELKYLSHDEKTLKPMTWLEDLETIDGLEDQRSHLVSEHFDSKTIDIQKSAENEERWRRINHPKSRRLSRSTSFQDLPSAIKTYSVDSHDRIDCKSEPRLRHINSEDALRTLTSLPAEVLRQSMEELKTLRPFNLQPQTPEPSTETISATQLSECLEPPFPTPDPDIKKISSPELTKGQMVVPIIVVEEVPAPEISSEDPPKKRVLAKVYMRQVYARSEAATSALSIDTEARLAKVGPLTVWQDPHMKYVEYYAATGKAKALRRLLRAGCNPGTPWRPRPKPLLDAVRGKTDQHNKCVRALLENDADPNVKWGLSGKTPLHLAIESAEWSGYTNLVWTLLRYGADPNIGDKTGEVPLLQILYGDYEPLAEYRRDALALLLAPQWKIKPNVNATPRGSHDKPLHLAVRRKDPWAVGMLLERDANVHAVNSTGDTAILLSATSWGKVVSDEELEILRLLLEHGANPSNQKPNTGRTPLHTAVLKSDIRAVSVLMEFGADPFLKHAEGKSAIQIAGAIQKQSNHSSMMKILFSKKTDVDLPTSNDECAIVTAVKKNLLPTATLLLESGASPKHICKTENKSVLDMAVQSGNEAMSNLLRSFSAEATHG